MIVYAILFSSFSHTGFFMNFSHSYKPLNHSDISGENFTEQLFSADIHPYFLDFDRIQYNQNSNQWTIIEHVMLEQPVANFHQLPTDVQNKINLLLQFKDFMTSRFEQSFLYQNTPQPFPPITPVRMVIDFYFPKESAYCHDILILNPQNKTLEHMDTSHYAQFFKTMNSQCATTNYLPNPNLISCDTFLNSRIDNSSFAISKACLGFDVNYGFNVDKVLFFPQVQECAIFEYLLCEASQKINPYSSHPNRYYRKNAHKFQSLLKLSQSLQTPVYMLNYAKEGLHVNKVLFMKLLDIDTHDIDPVKTLNKETTIQQLQASMYNRFAVEFPQGIIKTKV